jgi:voltage-gated potassium channel
MWPGRVRDVLRGVRPSSDSARDAYNNDTATFWLVVSLAYLSSIALQLLGGLSYKPWFLAFDVLMSLVFAVDYGLRFYMARRKLRFVFHLWNLADVLVILTPFLTLRFDDKWLGVFRVVRVARLLEILWKKAGYRAKRGQVKWVAEVALVMVFLAGVLVWFSERTHPDSSLHSVFDVVWWALVTMFTVGYGDAYPHTVLGKLGALILMVAGIALFGMLTASLASLYVESSGEEEVEKQRMKDMHERLRSMEQKLDELLDDKRERETGTTAAQVTPDAESVQAVNESTR